MIKIIQTLVLLTILKTVFSQPINNIWYIYKDIGMDFSTNPPQLLNDGNLLYNAVGCASICDSFGNLLFYSDGQTAWDKTHSIMPHGTRLDGMNAEYENALIQQVPGSDEKYYLFYPSPYYLKNGLYYSIVDMSLNSGLGDIIPETKNSLLIENTVINALTVQGPCGSIWLITHERFTNLFYIFKITESGIELYNSQLIGPKLNLQRSGLIITGSPNNDFIAISELSGLIYLFRFDAYTGNLSDPLPIHLPPTIYNSHIDLAFSPDGTKLYVTEPLYNTGEKVFISQYLLSNYTETAINASQYRIPTNFQSANDMALAPNGVIYISHVNDNFLSAITNPDGAQAQCHYVDTAYYLGDRSHDVNTIDPYFARQSVLPRTVILPPPSFRSDTAVCPDNLIQLIKPDNISRFAWWDGDTSSYRIISSPGTYWLEIEKDGCIRRDSITVSEISTSFITLPNDTTLCPGYQLRINIPTSMTATWWDGSSANPYEITTSGLYWVDLEQNGCVLRDTIQVLTASPGSLHISSDSFSCETTALELTATSGFSSYRWNTGQTTHTITISDPGSYWVHGFSDEGCIVSDTIIIHRNCECDVYIPNIFSPNGDGNNDVFTIHSACLFTTFQVDLYSRWGQHIFHSSDSTFQWNGGDWPPGVYVYKITYLSVNTINPKVLTGSVVLLR